MNKTPDLSEVERLMLSNQFRILAALEPANSEQHSKFAAILQAGHAGFYGDIFDTLGPPTTEAEMDETNRILTMFSYIDTALRDLSPEDQAQLNLPALHFDGFYGNRDSHHSLATFMRDTLGNFAELQGKDLDSHESFSLERYRRMLSSFTLIRRESGGMQLTVPDLQRIAKAATSVA
jgi:uncharacterized protein YfbU (UPF0304 family)